MVRRIDIPDVVCPKIHTGELERAERALIHVRYFCINYSEDIYLEGIYGLQGPLPAAFPKRSLTPYFLLGLGEVDIHFRAIKQEVPNQPAM